MVCTESRVSSFSLQVPDYSRPAVQQSKLQLDATIEGGRPGRHAEPGCEFNMAKCMLALLSRFYLPLESEARRFPRPTVCGWLAGWLALI